MSFLSLPAKAFHWYWHQWPLIMLSWFFCAVWVVVAVKHEKHKALLSVFGNGVFGTLIVMPFALDIFKTAVNNNSNHNQSLCERIRTSLTPLKKRFGIVLFISILAGLERNWMLLWVPRFRDFAKLRVSKYSKNFALYPCKTAL